MNLLAGFREWLTGGDTTITLTRAGKTVAGPVLVGRWRTESDNQAEYMRASVTFGPFLEETEFDGAVIARGDLTETVRFPSVGRAWAGDTFIYHPEVIFTRDAL